MFGWCAVLSEEPARVKVWNSRRKGQQQYSELQVRVNSARCLEAIVVIHISTGWTCYYRYPMSRYSDHCTLKVIVMRIGSKHWPAGVWVIHSVLATTRYKECKYFTQITETQWQTGCFLRSFIDTNNQLQQTKYSQSQLHWLILLVKDDENRQPQWIWH